ncbi:hypothetical protein [Haloimpatiens massiliensis]|uniref:hypothetical protein n=1 Tax=Haloimpatiens massiliensis TaxID=1658110 RepID=UPI000C825CEE|nr:hypothetical protein [Haloimpatiens massiliensis]
MKRTIFSKIKIPNIKKLKVIIACAVIITVFTSGFVIYAINISKPECKSSKQKVQPKISLADSSQDKKLSQSGTKAEEKPKIEKTFIKENKLKKSYNKVTQKNINNKNKPAKKQLVKQNKIKNNKVNPTKKEGIQKKQVSNKPITYKNKKLGICFDMPASWANKYFIKDNGTEVRVYMRNKHNLDSEDGFLFIITTDIHDYNDGKFLDSIGGIDKIKVINDKKYLIGGPTGVTFPGDNFNDNPEFKTFSQLNNDRAVVIKTLRSVN